MTNYANDTILHREYLILTNLTNIWNIYELIVTNMIKNLKKKKKKKLWIDVKIV